MPINFPDAPSSGDTHTVGDKTWTYDGTAWNVVQNNIADHGNLGGLGDDDHTQYALADGTRGTFEASGAVSTHEAASDPHTQYLLADGTRTATEVTVSGDLTVDTDTLHVDSTNNRVGIGTTSPAEELHIAKDQNGDLTQILIENLDQRVRIGSYYEAGVVQYGKIQSEQDAGGDIALVLNPEGGNVGIGTTTPAEKVDVGGNVRANTGKFIANRAGADQATAKGGVDLQIDGTTYMSLQQTSAGVLEVGNDTGRLRLAPSQIMIGSNHNGYESNVVGGVPSGSITGTNGGQIRLGGPSRGDSSVNAIEFWQNGNYRGGFVNGGAFRLTNQPYFFAYGFDWSYVAAYPGAVAKPTVVNQRNVGAYGYSTSTGRFYAPVDGLYMVGVEAGCYSGGNNHPYWRLILRFNGVNIHDSLENISYISTGTHSQIVINHLLEMTTGQYLDFTHDTSIGTSLTAYGGQFFWGYLIG